MNRTRPVAVVILVLAGLLSTLSSAAAIREDDPRLTTITARTHDLIADNQT